MAMYVIKHDDLIFSEISETSKTTEQQQVKQQPLSTTTLEFKKNRLTNIVTYKYRRPFYVYCGRNGSRECCMLSKHHMKESFFWIHSVTPLPRQ